MASDRLILVSFVSGSEAQKNSLLLAASIRSFAGRLADTPVKFIVPQGEIINPKIERSLNKLKIELEWIEIPQEIASFPLASLPYAAGKAEEEALDVADILVWLSSETMILNEPLAFMLPDDKFLGVRPVHHLLIGSRWDQPIDRFWSTVFHLTGFKQESSYPMITVADGVKIRPYFNAGFIVARIEKKTLQSWREAFLNIYQIPELMKLYEADPRYRIFIHQAIFTGVALAKLGRDGIVELPSSYNYPLHLYKQDSTSNKPHRLENLTTFRFESTFNEPNWIDWIPAGERLKDWLNEQLENL